MAHILELVHNPSGLTSIINVSQKVGPTKEGGVNNQNDVDAVEKLIIIASGGVFDDGFVINNNGNFDPVTGYTIYRTQANLKRNNPAITLDGIISPAKGVGYGANTKYTIVKLNEVAKNTNSAAYDEFRRTFRCIG
jgi:hypothetical protein